MITPDLRPLGLVPESAWTTIKKDAVPDKIISMLLSMIQSAKLRPGDKLPPERVLASTLHVSRPSLREALRALARMKVVEIRPGTGAFVTSLEPSTLIEHMDFIFSLGNATFLQLFEARRIIEPVVAALAAERMTDEEIQGLVSLLDSAIENVDHYEKYVQIDSDIHEAIIRAVRNPVLEQLMASIKRLSHTSRRRTSSIPGFPQQTLEDLKALVQAFRVRDPATAHAAMSRHLSLLEQQYRGRSEETVQPNQKQFHSTAE